MILVPDDLTGRELFKFLKANKSILKAQKKYEVKHADAVSYSKMVVTQKGDAVKANLPVSDDPNPNEIQVLSVINTTNWLDSHGDVHIPGLWKKSLAENKDLYLLQEHNMSFKGIITDKVTAFTQKLTWASLGINEQGSTEALLFDSTIPKNRNEYMFGEYQNGHVKNHSVGMRYVNMVMAVNEPEDKYFREEYDAWEKFLPMIINKDIAEERGYFWAVLEAKAIEGSAVPIGSNRVTPTLNVSNSTKQQPVYATDDLPQEFDVIKAIQQTQFVNF